MSQITLSAWLVTLISTFVIPIITGLLTKYNAGPGLKQFVTAILSAVAGLISSGSMPDGTATFSKETLLLVLTTFIVTQATYLGIYKPFDLNGKTAPGSGIGKSGT